MNDILEKMPNWLRYILAIPVSALLAYSFEFIFVYILSPLKDGNIYDLILLLEQYLVVNVGVLLVFFYYLNIILPAYQFQFTCGICILLGSLYCIVLGMSITWGFSFNWISFILSMLTFIITPYLSYLKVFD